MIRSVIASWTLFFGLLMISAGSGLQNVLLGTRAPEIGFSNIATGFVMSGYFVGIFFWFDYRAIHFGDRWPCPRFWRHVSNRVSRGFDAYCFWRSDFMGIHEARQRLWFCWHVYRL